MELTLYYTPKTRAFRVRWLLEELGLEYRLEHIDLHAGEGNTPEYRAIHPLGQVPALKVDNEVMFESGAMLQWLAETHLDKGLAPALDSPWRRISARPKSPCASFAIRTTARATMAAALPRCPRTTRVCARATNTAADFSRASS